jgi:hypothetical protein
MNLISSVFLTLILILQDDWAAHSRVLKTALVGSEGPNQLEEGEESLFGWDGDDGANVDVERLLLDGAFDVAERGNIIGILTPTLDLHSLVCKWE